jgi:hypothetical protein
MRTGNALAKALRDGDLTAEEIPAVVRQLAESPYAELGAGFHPTVRDLSLHRRHEIAEELGIGHAVTSENRERWASEDAKRAKRALFIDRPGDALYTTPRGSK